MFRLTIFITFLFIVCFSPALSQDRIIISPDYSHTEIRSKRVKLSLLVNKAEDLSISGEIFIDFGSNQSSLTSIYVGEIEPTDGFNEKHFYFRKDNLNSGQTYYFRWRLESNDIVSLDTDLLNFTTPSSFDILPKQLFELKEFTNEPGKDLKEGDTIGRIKYEDTQGSWAKVKTYYKTSMALKDDGTIWAWGRNSRKLVPSIGDESEVIYEPYKIQYFQDPEVLQNELDRDNDGYWNIDEELSGPSFATSSSTIPVDSDNDGYSDLFEESLGLDKNNDYISSSDYEKLRNAILPELTLSDLLLYDFDFSRSAAIGIEKNSRNLYFWGAANGGGYISSEMKNIRGHLDGTSKQMPLMILEKNNGEDMYYEVPELIDQNHRWEKVVVSDNFLSPKYPNINGLDNIWDTTVAGITEDKKLFVWGVVDGILLYEPLQIGTNLNWVDVAVAEGIVAVSEDGSLYQLAMSIPDKPEDSSTDTDGDGVNDNIDRFKWDYNYQFDSDDDGLPDKYEKKLVTNDLKDFDKDGKLNWNDPDSDNDGIWDGEDDLPFNPNDSIDSDGDGLGVSLDLSNGDIDGDGLDGDNDPDKDGDGVPDGEDADPNDSNKKWDTDGDGLTDEEEWENSSDPYKKDTDADGYDDKEDYFPSIPHYYRDSDGDGLPDKLEEINETNPNSADSDGDGFIDGISVEKFDEFRSLASSLSENYDCSSDWRMCDQWLYFWKFWDLKYDCNGDGWISREEWEGTAESCKTFIKRDDFPMNNEYSLDTDGDRLADKVDDDDDNDGYYDEIEIFVQTDSKNWRSRPEDSDDDNIPDKVEMEGYEFNLNNGDLKFYTIGTDPFNRDTDGDGAWDGWDDWPLDNQISQDQDRDYIDDWRERWDLKTEVNNPDTDGDGVDDLHDDFPLKSWTVTRTFDSGTKDSDKDGVSDEYEIEVLETNPNNPDHDGDGFKDGPCREGIKREFDENGKFVRWYWDWRECYPDGEIWKYDKLEDRWYNENSWRVDAFPKDSNNYRDTDGDGEGDNTDEDIDGDGVPNDQDDLPYDKDEYLNSDKPTRQNGGLTDYAWNGTDETNGNGIFGEDVNDDGWIDEANHIGWKFDFIGDNTDQDDDGDSFLDVDEEFSGTDPKDPLSFPGSGFADFDNDGVSNNYEINKSNSDPDFWDSDGDGVSDGWRYPNDAGYELATNWVFAIEIPSLSATLKQGDLFKLEIRPYQFSDDQYNKNYEYTAVNSSTSGLELLQNFRDQINADNQLSIFLDGGIIETNPISATISNTRLIVQGKYHEYSNRGMRFDYDHFVTVIDESSGNSKIHIFKPTDRQEHLTRILEEKRDLEAFIKGEGGYSEIFFKNGNLGSRDNNDPYLIDAFPNDPTRYVDTDSDGLDDKEDNDIDGDGVINIDDELPWDPTDSKDIDGDGIGDSRDFSSMKADTDSDGLSNEKEIEIGTDPRNWDTDGDGFSDGPKTPHFVHDDNFVYGIMDVGSVTATTQIGDEFRVRLEGHNMNCVHFNQKVYTEFSLTTTSPITGLQLMEYFRDRFNELVGIQYRDVCDDGNSFQFQPISAFIVGNKLYLKNQDSDNNMRFWGRDHISLIPDNGKLYDYPRDQDHFREIGRLQGSKNNCSSCTDFQQNYLYGQFKSYQQDDQSAPYVQDAFPLNKYEYWDTDKDGVGDNSDDDIDGDGINNSQDEAPFDKNGSVDKNKNGIADSNDFNSYFDDSDFDGLVNGYELNESNTDPFNWDTDGDGFSDGFKEPCWDYDDRVNQVQSMIVDIPKSDLYTIPGETYRFEVIGHENHGHTVTEISFTVTQSISGSDLLNNFKETLLYDHNNKILVGLVSDTGDNSSSNYLYVDITTKVEGNKLIIQTTEPSDYDFYILQDYYYQENNTFKRYREGRYHDSRWLGERLYDNKLEAFCDPHNYDGIGFSNDSSTRAVDAFPLDPNEFWDTDGDGIGDNSDDDLDGDGIDNFSDPLPYDGSSDLDTDGDGVINSYDEDDDNDGVLDIDEIYHNSNQVSASLDNSISNGPDSDGDGLSDSYEENVTNTNPELWDTDGDGISDGYKFPGIDQSKANADNFAFWVPNKDLMTVPDESYEFFLGGDQSITNGNILVRYQSSISVRAEEMMTYFKDQLNILGQNFVDGDQNTKPFTARLINGNLIIIEWGPDIGSVRKTNFTWNATIPGSDGYLVKLPFMQTFVSELYRYMAWNYLDRDTSYHDSIRVKYGRTFRNNENIDAVYFYDMFPNDPTKFWDTDGDGIDDNYDNDIDGDGVYNEDENAPFDGTSIYDFNKNGIGFNNEKDDDLNGDYDKDGLTNLEELEIDTDPLNWDTDGDGISDGPKVPHQDYNNDFIYPVIDVGNVSATTLIGDEYRIKINGRDISCYGQEEDLIIDFSYSPTSPITGQQLLEHFRDLFNSRSIINYRMGCDGDLRFQQIEAKIIGPYLILKGLGTGNERHFWADTNSLISTIADDGKLYQYQRDNEHFERIGDNLFPKSTWDNEVKQNYLFGSFRDGDDSSAQFVQDAFPLNKYEFWDTDGDGIGDNSDDDIDGDLVSNSQDEAPFDPDSTTDVDGDGIGDANDPSSMDLDTDGDGLINRFEILLGTDPKNWDTDGDRISDGGLYPWWEGDWQNFSWKFIIDINKASKKMKPDNYVIKIWPHNQDGGGRRILNGQLDNSYNQRRNETRIEIDLSSTQQNDLPSGLNFLNQLSESINLLNTIPVNSYDKNNQNKNAEIRAQVVSISEDNERQRLIISGANSPYRDFHIDGFSLIHDQNYNSKIIYNEWWKAEHFYRNFRDNVDPKNEKKLNKRGEVINDNSVEAITLKDYYPLDSSKYFDLDGDGIDDFNDNDIDGDLVSNSEDALPYDIFDSLDSDNDGIGNSQEQNKDNDNFLDIDEEYNGTDPLVWTDALGGLDSDSDGFSDIYEIDVLESNPYKWDTDGDGYSDGWQYPCIDNNGEDWDSYWNKIGLKLTIASSEKYVKIGEKFTVIYSGRGMDWREGLVLEHTVSSTITGGQLLEIFAEKINTIGQITYRKNHDWNNNDPSNFSQIQIAATVSGSVLTIISPDGLSDTTTNTNENFGRRIYMQSSFYSEIQNDKIISLGHGNLWNWRKEIELVDRKTNNCFGDKYFIQGGERSSPERGGVLLIDMFPNDPLEFWDTDGDGIGDNSDEDDDNDGRLDVDELTRRGDMFSHRWSNPYLTDTDGDGVNDGIDEIPWNKEETIDTDGDYRGNLNEDGDDDNDGLSDDEENEMGTDPLNQDSDNDGFSDGCRGFGFDKYNDNGHWIETVKITKPSNFVIGESGEYKIYLKGDGSDRYSFGGVYSPEKETFFKPNESPEWAGFANHKRQKISFPNGGRITFLGSAKSAVKLIFKFEKMFWSENGNGDDDLFPLFTTSEIEISGEEYKEYTIEIQSQPASNTFTNHIINPITAEAEFKMKDIVITSYNDQGNTNYSTFFGRKIIEFSGNASSTVGELLSFFESEINSFGEIEYIDCCGSNDSFRQYKESVSAKVSGTSLIIEGEQEQQNLRVYFHRWDGMIRRFTTSSFDDCYLNKDQFPLNENEWFDSDWDGVGDNEDPNDDWDGLTDIIENEIGTDPYNGDTDGDYWDDSWDKMPLDPSSRNDLDGDGIPDEKWIDQNGDGFFDLRYGGDDGYPEPVDEDLDGDGLSNEHEENTSKTSKWDSDSDDDGYNDKLDVFPLYAAEALDTDSDKIGDNADRDDDNDGFSDLDEIFVGTNTLSPTSYPNNDQDNDFMSDEYEAAMGTLDNESDTDNDGTLDGLDAFPLNKDEWYDSDGDGIGNNQDDNDDNDFMLDWVELKMVENNLATSSSTILYDRQVLFNDNDKDGIPNELEVIISTNFESNTSSNSTDWTTRYFSDFKDEFRTMKYYRMFTTRSDSQNNGEDGAWDATHYFEGPFGSEWYNIPVLDLIDYYGFSETELDDFEVREIQRNPTNNNFDGDFYDNIDDDDSDDDGIPDGRDIAIFDPNGILDSDFDFIEDNHDEDLDNDNIHNDDELIFGTDKFNPDSDGDNVNDFDDSYPNDSRLSTNNEISNILQIQPVNSGISNWKNVSAWNHGHKGSSYAAITDDNDLYVWGLNYGALPTHDEFSLDLWQSGINYAYVIPVNSMQKVYDEIEWEIVSLGYKFGMGSTTNGEFYSWGRNLSSQLGKGKPSTFVKFTSPKIYMGEIKQITTGDQQAGIINIDGKLRMIGSNDQGQLGTGAPDFNIPRELDWEPEIPSNDIKEVKVTRTETQIITNNNKIWAYGENDFAQLGRGGAFTVADNFKVKEIEDKSNWDEIYAISETVFAFKQDGTLWAWGRNDEFQLGIGKRNEDGGFEKDPVQVFYHYSDSSNSTNKKPVLKSEIIDFSPVEGGFVFINTDGELFAAGTNFYTGKWFPLPRPRKIGTDSDWLKLHDFVGSEINILIEKNDGSIWGSGANWNLVLTDTPCPESINEIWEVEITHPRQKVIKVYEIGPMTGGSASITLLVGDITKTANATNTSSFVRDIVSAFTSDSNFSTSFSVTSTISLNSTSTIKFSSKNYKDHKFGKSISNKSSTTFSVDINLREEQKNISGITTYTLNFNNIQFEVVGNKEDSFTVEPGVVITDIMTSLKFKLENSNKLPKTFSYTISKTNTTSETSLLEQSNASSERYKLIIKNNSFNSFFLNGSVKNTQNAEGTLTVTKTTSLKYVECDNNNPFISKLTEVFDSSNSWDKISLGEKHAIALDDNGKLFSWGKNTQGQLGIGDVTNETEFIGQPTLISSVSNTLFVDVSASAEVSFAITDQGKMYSWGDNDLGTLGVGDNTDKDKPTNVINNSNVTWEKNLGGYRFQVAIGRNSNNQKIPYGWGYQKFGELGLLGKVKQDSIVWDTDLNQSKGIVETTADGEFLIATKLLVNYMETMLDFEYEGTIQPNSDVVSTTQTNKSTKIGTKGFGNKSSKVNSKTKGIQSSTRKMSVGKWKVKKSKPSFKGKSAISTADLSRNSQLQLYDFELVEVNERPTDIALVEVSNKNYIGNLSGSDPEGDILTYFISPLSPNKDKFSVSGQKLYFDTKTNKALVPYRVNITAKDWEDLEYTEEFEVFVDEDGQVNIIEVQNQVSGGGGYNQLQRVIDSDGDGFTDYDETLAGSDPFDFRDFPRDSDNDGIYDPFDTDLDNDGVINELDSFPYNPNEALDSDGDGLGNNIDPDDDNDGIDDISANWQDGYIIQDLFPLDPNESSDFDGDGIGDNADPDDDNDGFDDDIDAFPNNPFEWLDTDGDGIGDNSDIDNDNDGFSNFDEELLGTDPSDPNSFPSDMDNDFVPDALDSDLDGDAIPNDFDNAPEFYNPNQEYIENDPNFIQIIPPTFFTPNGDGKNDTWAIAELNRYPNNKVWLYDSSGNLILFKENYNNDWNGSSNGKIVPNGSYLYVIEIDGNKSDEIKGWVYITR